MSGGSGGSGGKSKKGGTPTPNPIVADDTERSISNVTLVDVISEGPILGLANGAQSIFFQQQPIMLPSGAFQTQGIAAHFRYGFPEQDPLPFQHVQQTFDVNQQVRSATNSIQLIRSEFTDGLLVGAEAVPSQGVIISDLPANVVNDTRNVIQLGNPGDGTGRNDGLPPFVSGILNILTGGQYSSTSGGTGSTKQTAVPTVAPTAALVWNAGAGQYEVALTNPGSNVIGNGNRTQYSTLVYHTSGIFGTGWYVGPTAEIVGGVVRTITNPNCNAVRLLLKVDKLFQESGNGDIHEATLRFAVQYRTIEDSWVNGTSLIGNKWESFADGIQIGPIPSNYDQTGAWLKAVVAVAVNPFSHYTATIQDGITQFGIGPGPVTGHLWGDAGDAFSGYSHTQHGFNGSAQTQIMYFSLYASFNNGFNLDGYQNLHRVIEETGNGTVLSVAWYTRRAVLLPDYTQVDLADGVLSVYAKTQSGFNIDITMALPSRVITGDIVQIRVLRLSGDDVYVGIDAPSVATALGMKQEDTEKRANFWITFSSFSWGAYVEMTEINMQYADTAVMGLQLNSQWTGSSVPARAYDVYGRIIRVPSNYDAFNHTYTGIWDGTFVQSWSDNPVWVFLDLLTHERYGLGQWIKDSTIDFAALYQVAQYCDEAIETDGDEAPGPRFTFNTQIISQDQAYSVLAMLSSVFRGMIYWAAGGITITQDSPQDPTRIVGPSNVINGDFQYVGSALQARHSVVLVTWQDPDDFGKDRIDVYEDAELIDRYGYVTTELKAWGCNRLSQALRMAKWFLETEKHATETVTYRAGFDHADARPGEIVAIADPNVSGIRHSGRLVKPGTVRLTIDAAFNFDPGESYTLTIQIPSWGKVSVVNGSTTVTGSNTAFLSMGGNIIVFEGQTKQYPMTVLDNLTITLNEPYTGRDLDSVEFTMLYDNGFTVSFIGSSPIPIVDRPINNPGILTSTFDLTAPLPIMPIENVQYLITGGAAEPRLFTIVANREIDTHTYEINGLAYDPAKFARVENS